MRWTLIYGKWVKGRKAQMEAVGLVVIVILITLGMLFMAMFALNEDPKKKIFTRKGLAYSTMSAIMKSTVSPEEGCVPFGSNTMAIEIGKDILEDCASNQMYRTLEECGFSCKYRCREKHSCIFFREIVTELLNSTLGEWNKRYEFKSELITVREAEPLKLLDPSVKSARGGCRKRDTDTSGLFPIHVSEAGLVENILELCD